MIKNKTLSDKVYGIMSSILDGEKIDGHLNTNSSQSKPFSHSLVLHLDFELEVGYVWLITIST